MRLLEASRLAGVRHQEAKDVADAWETVRNRHRAALIRLVAAGGSPEELRAAERRQRAAALQLAEARNHERDAWAEAGRL
jgi:hypothetical protein